MSNNNHSQPQENLSSNIPTPATRPIVPDLRETNYEQGSENAETVAGITEPDTRPASHRDQTASDLASIIVSTFAWSIKLSFLISILHFGIVSYSFAVSGAEEGKEYPRINESMEIFKTVSAVMSGPIGFVFGFYFRENNR